MENDDHSAALQCELLASVKLTPADLTPWNAYPWYRHDQSSGLRSPQITEGLDPLTRLINVMPKLEVVLLQGGEAQTPWKRFARKHPNIAARHAAVETYTLAGRRSGMLTRQSGKPGPGDGLRPSRRSGKFWT
ncbi:hypothetical protein [Pseudarthrobacter sp. LT1]|uniref:hypothetical protein n=1 Tax=Pseudarthrobacter sp. LT1 TaxID=3111450 RepID=UPI002D776839|nr:hypothetical protein [Pseudarthrobacter sp. LT1]WRT15635.1 hypothetical protein VIK36_09230 [Pseudarthrobacter sp. LT1]